MSWRAGRDVPTRDEGGIGTVSAEDLEKYETEMELTLYQEYRDIVGQFSYVVETERRFYLANAVDLQVAQRRRRDLLRGPDVRRLGLGHVPARPVREERAGGDVQGRQRRGAGQARPAVPRGYQFGSCGAAHGPRSSTRPRLSPSRVRLSTACGDVRPRRRAGPRQSWAAMGAEGRAGPTRRGRRRGVPGRARASWCSTATGGAGDGELDIVARDGDALVVCEVKTRSRHRLRRRPPRRSTRRKAARIRRLAACAGWPRTACGWCELRFDVVAVLAEPGARSAVQHCEAAF